MLSLTIWALALCSGVGSAFQDTSPFFLFSKSPPRNFQADTPQIIRASELNAFVETSLGRCFTDSYVLVSQPGAAAADYDRKDSIPQMQARMLGKEGRIFSKLAVRDVVGQISLEKLSKLLQDKCDAGITKVDASTGSFAIADEKRYRVMTLEFPALPDGQARAEKLAEHDAFLASVLDWLPSPDYTVIYTTTPRTSQPQSSATEPELYEMDTIFGSPVHMDSKRDFSSHRRATNNVTLPAGPLFERYQFFNTGLFMAFIVVFILFSILYVAISAVSGLQVSYAAFDKEVGAAQKKAQ